MNTSWAKESSFLIERSPVNDLAEPDNSYTQAKIIVLNSPDPQYHTFSFENDQDWVKFYAIANVFYTIDVFNAQSNCDAVLSLFSEDFEQIAHEDSSSSGRDESIEIKLSEDGFYYLCIVNYNGIFGEDTGYNLSAFRPIPCLTHLLKGTILDASTQNPVNQAVLRTYLGGTGISDSLGHYNIHVINCNSEPINLTIFAQDYLSLNQYATLTDASETELNLQLISTHQPDQVYYVFERLWPFQVEPFIHSAFSKKMVMNTKEVDSYMAIDTDGYIYMLDTNAACIKKMDASFNLITRWGKAGTNNGEFLQPQGICLDRNNHVYVADTGNHRIQKFSSDGEYITTWGEEGIFPGQFKYPTTISIHPDEKVYVMDSGNNRYQIFKKVTQLPKTKAIVVAGKSETGIYERRSAMACHALLHQGYTWDQITWLSSPIHYTDYDAQIAHSPSKVILKESILNWASDSSSLLICMIGQGQDQQIDLNPDEAVQFSELNDWLNLFQGQTGKSVMIIYDADYGNVLINELATKDYERFIITSSGEQIAHYHMGGIISFSTFFWHDIFYGKTIATAWRRADYAMNQTLYLQKPQMDFTGDGLFDDSDFNLATEMSIGAGTSFQCVRADIKKITANVMQGKAKIFVDVQLDNASSDIDVKGFMSHESHSLTTAFDLIASDGDHYTAIIDRELLAGDYQISIVGIHANGSISEPEMLTVTIEPLFVPGDMNGDGFLGLGDLIMMLRILSGKIIY
jgi:hypothetical protein